jgi:hypothetical protein
VGGAATMIPFTQLSYADLALVCAVLSYPLEISVSGFNDLLVIRLR